MTSKIRQYLDPQGLSPFAQQSNTALRWKPKNQLHTQIIS